MARLQAGHAAGQHIAELEQAREVQADEGEQRGERGHDRRALQLEAPAELFTRRAQGQQQATQRQEGQHHAGRVGQAVGAVRAGVAAVLREPGHLDGQHGKHAGHEVEDEAADERADQRRAEGERAGRWGGRGGGGGRARGVGVERGLQGVGHAGRGQRRRCGPGALHGHGGQARAGLARAFARGLGGRHHQVHGRGAVEALRGQRHARGPARAVPGLGPGGAGLDHAAQFGEELQLAPPPVGGQAVQGHAQEAVVGRDQAGARLQVAWPGVAHGGEQLAVAAGGAAGGQAQHEARLLRDAFLAAHQPARVQSHVHGLAAEVVAHRQRHGQHHGAVVAVVGQGADGEFARRGPVNVTRAHAFGQGPAQLGGQPGIARVLPVGVPVRCVVQAQPQPDGAAGAGALGRVGQQLGARLLRLEHAGGRRAFHEGGEVLRGCGEGQAQRQAAQGGEQEAPRARGQGRKGQGHDQGIVGRRWAPRYERAAAPEFRQGLCLGTGFAKVRKVRIRRSTGADLSSAIHGRGFLGKTAAWLDVKHHHWRGPEWEQSWKWR